MRLPAPGGASSWQIVTWGSFALLPDLACSSQHVAMEPSPTVRDLEADVSVEMAKLEEESALCEAASLIEDACQRLRMCDAHASCLDWMSCKAEHLAHSSS